MTITASPSLERRLRREISGEVMFGARIISAFEEVKQGLDPSHLFNPGRIVAPPMKDDRSLLRYGADMAAAMQLCVSCKACKREFPTGVDMARMKIEVLAAQTRAQGLTLHDRLIAYLPRYAPAGAERRNSGMLPGPDTDRVAAHAMMFEDYIAQQTGNGAFDLNLGSLTGKVMLHGHCHQKAFGVISAVE